MPRSARIEPIERATNKSWDEGLRILAVEKAETLPHQQIAAIAQRELEGKIDSPGWWGQSVAVAYEQHIGRRLPGQRADGTFEVSTSKATQFDMHELMDTWTSFADKDDQVKGYVSSEPRLSGTNKRLNWRVKCADGSSIQITSEPKNNGKATIIATVSGLSDCESAADAQAEWSAIIERFASLNSV